jgi:hypothetical protein
VIVLRSSEWDGPSPSPGDVVITDDHDELVVAAVENGAGVGHFTLRCVETTGRIWRWRSVR